jgi:hypothetical protein
MSLPVEFLSGADADLHRVFSTNLKIIVKVSEQNFCSLLMRIWLAPQRFPKLRHDTLKMFDGK